MRLASPGDDGDLAQTIAAQAAATVANATAAVQEAAQLVPAPRPPPVVSPASSEPPSEAFISTPVLSSPATVLQSQIDDGPAVLPSESLGADDAPRHGGQALLASWHPGGEAATHRSGSMRGIQALRSSRPTRAPLVLVELIRPSGAVDEHHSGGAGPTPSRLLPPPVPAPPLDAPLSTLVAMSPVGPQSAGSGLVALATGGLGLFLLFFASYLVPLSRAVRARAGVAEPHPPG